MTFLTEDIPDNFLCPITQELMVNPLMSRSGISFDRKAILEWISEHNNSCPMTRQPLRVCDLVPNRNLQAKIFAWCLEHGEEEAYMDMPFNADGTCHMEVNLPAEVFLSCDLPKSKKSSNKNELRPMTSTLNFARRSIALSSGRCGR